MHVHYAASYLTFIAWRCMPTDVGCIHLQCLLACGCLKRGRVVVLMSASCDVLSENVIICTDWKRAHLFLICKSNRTSPAFAVCAFQPCLAARPQWQVCMRGVLQSLIMPVYPSHTLFYI